MGRDETVRLMADELAILYQRGIGSPSIQAERLLRIAEAAAVRAECEEAAPEGWPTEHDVLATMKQLEGERWEDIARRILALFPAPKPARDGWPTEEQVKTTYWAAFQAGGSEAGALAVSALFAPFAPRPTPDRETVAKALWEAAWRHHGATPGRSWEEARANADGTLSSFFTEADAALALLAGTVRLQLPERLTDEQVEELTRLLRRELRLAADSTDARAVYDWVRKNVGAEAPAPAAEPEGPQPAPDPIEVLAQAAFAVRYGGRPSWEDTHESIRRAYRRWAERVAEEQLDETATGPTEPARPTLEQVLEVLDGRAAFRWVRLAVKRTYDDAIGIIRPKRAAGCPEVSADE